jgi:hypothetical protein
VACEVKQRTAEEVIIMKKWHKKSIEEVGS